MIEVSEHVDGQVLDLGISSATLCGHGLIHLATTRDIECFAGRMRGVARCQKKSSFSDLFVIPTDLPAEVGRRDLQR